MGEEEMEEEPNGEEDSGVETTERTASPTSPAPPNANNTVQLLADIDELLAGSDEEQEEGDAQAEVERDVEIGLARWRGRCAKTSLSFALSNILEGQADLTNHPGYDHLRPRFDKIRDEIHLVLGELNQKIEELLNA